MTKFKFERQIPQKRLERGLNSGAQKLKRIIEKEQLRITPRVEDELEHLPSNLTEQYKLNLDDITSSDLLKRVLEMLYKEGTFSGKLEKEYIKLIAEEVIDMLANGTEMVSQAIGKKIVELKQKGIEIDQEQLRQTVEQKIE